MTDIALSKSEKFKVIVVAPFLLEEKGSMLSLQSKEDRLLEIRGLVEALDLEIFDIYSLNIRQLRPATFLGKGKVEELKQVISEEKIQLVILDTEITPIQQRNLEKNWNCKVIDRTGLILEIFQKRAQTREGVLQVQLAHLQYQKSRLVRSWTHLERQKGGSGFLGGPGETQIESDKRQLQEKMIRVKNSLDKVIQTRSLHRKNRKKSPQPLIALVGYTNSGKTTLFNYLTKSKMLAKDMLFATLDPALRRMQLPRGNIAILSDTVGFISNLPTELVAAFRATLEEILEADIILHVRDFSNKNHANQAEDVKSILTELGVDINDKTKIYEIWNKIDKFSLKEKEITKKTAKDQFLKTFPLSAKSGAGIKDLLLFLENYFFGQMKSENVKIEKNNTDGINAIYKYGKNVQILREDDNFIDFKIDFTPQDRDFFYEIVSK